MNHNLRTQFGIAAVSLVLLGSLGSNRAAAQALSQSQSPTLTITLKDALSFTMQTNAVNMTYETSADYNNGVSTVVNNQFMITSNKPYNLQVSASGDLSNGGSTPLTIPVSTISVAGINTPDITGTVASLTTTPQPLATAAPATQSKNISLKYATSKSDAFLQPAGNYTTTLTFTATQN